MSAKIIKFPMLQQDPIEVRAMKDIKLLAAYIAVNPRFVNDVIQMHAGSEEAYPDQANAMFILGFFQGITAVRSFGFDVVCAQSVSRMVDNFTGKPEDYIGKHRKYFKTNSFPGGGPSGDKKT